MRRLILPLVLAVVSAASAVAAVRVDAETLPVQFSVPSPVTPVFSARRVPSVIAAPVADRRLEAALNDLLLRSPEATCLSVSVGGRAVYAARPDVPLVPASLQKLLTGAAALEVLGEEFTYRTRVVTAAPNDAGVVGGDVYLVGGGDPLLQTDDYESHFEHQPQIRTDFEALADAIVAAGVRQIDGALVGDESRYDRDRYPDPWPARFIDQDQTGPLSALTVNDAWTTFPPNPDVTVPDEAPAADPAAHAAAVLTTLLVARGVAVAGTPASGTAPDGASELAVLDSPPMRDVVTEMLRESDNQTAELVSKELGLHQAGEGTTAAGVQAMADAIGTMALPGAGAEVSDGSGLSSGNRMTCGLVLTLLDRAGPASTLSSSLAVAGQSGTLEKRFLDTPVVGRLRAKTGTLNQVTGLAGYVDSLQGVGLSFSYVINVPEPDRVDLEHIGLQDELGAVLVRYPEGPPLDALGPKPVPSTAPVDPTQGGG